MATDHSTPADTANLTALAAAAFGPRTGADARSAADRDLLIAKLMGPLWGLAWNLAGPNHAFAEELRAHVLLRCEQGRYDPGRGSFAAWVQTVMSRHLITLVKSHGLAPGGDTYPERIDTRPTEFDCDDVRTAPFAQDDLDRIRRWGTPLKRALLLAQGLLWRKYPADLWSADLAALGLAEPFPCPEFEDMSQAERNAYLAGVLGVPRNTIHVRMRRWERHLRDLKFVRDLAAGT